MKKINWCKKKTKGIKLINPNTNLCEEYYRNAEESLRVLRSIKDTQSNMWLATTKYYLEYFAFYALLMKIGIKCEIHDCSIALAQFLEKENIIQGVSRVLEEDKELRIDNQYYLKNRPVEIDFEKISTYLLHIKEIVDTIEESKIEELREKINPSKPVQRIDQNSSNKIKEHEEHHQKDN